MPIKLLNEEKGKIIGRGVVDCVIELAALHFPAVNLAKSVVQTGKELHMQQQSREISFTEIEKICRAKMPEYVLLTKIKLHVLPVITGESLPMNSAIVKYRFSSESIMIIRRSQM